MRRSERPAPAKRPAERVAREAAPTSKRPATKRPATERPATERPAAKRPAAKRPAAERPATKRPAPERPSARVAPRPSSAPKTDGAVTDPVAQAKASVRGLGSAVLDRLIRFGREKIESGIDKLGESLTGTLGEVISDKVGGSGAGGGVGLAAMAGAAQAKLAGTNPILGGIRAGVRAMPTGIKVALVFGLLLALLLAPVLAILLLVALLVLGVVLALRKLAG